MREFFITNGRYWIEEFHFDGFRFDATQSIIDDSDEYIDGSDRPSGPRRRRRALDYCWWRKTNRRKRDWFGHAATSGDDLDAVWNDDWHHSAIVVLTGRNEAYYTDYLGSPQEFVSAAKYGYLYQGQPYHWQEAPRGIPAFDVRRPIRYLHREPRSGFEHR